jgi:glutathione S-transferase
MAMVIPDSYAWVLLSVVCICLHCYLQGVPIGGLRRKFFNKAFFAKHFPHINNNESGYPDMGQGRFADRLSDEDWITFNNAQRAHQNYLEALPLIITLVLVSGITYPRLAVFAAGLIIIGRQIYAGSYRKSGSKGRYNGLMLVIPSLFVCLIASVMSILEIGGGIAGLQTFLFAK